MARDLGILPVPVELRSSVGFDGAQSCGLFIGVRRFRDDRLAEVPYAVDDAIDLAWTFSHDLGLILPERVVLALAGEPQKPESLDRLERLVELGARVQPARLTEMYEELETLVRNVGREGLLLLTVATHGFSDQGGDFLVLEDSSRRRVAQTGLRVDTIFDDIGQAPAERRVVILDACRERLSAETRGGSRDAESMMGLAFQAAVSKARGQVVLCGARLGGYSYDDHQRRNGVFSSSIIDGLTGMAAPDPNGFITAETLAQFVGRRVDDWISRNRPEDADSASGIEVRMAGEAARLPLAIHRDGHERSKRRRALGEAAMRLLEAARAEDRELISGSLLDEVERRLQEPDCDELIEQMQELATNTAARRRAFVAWFRGAYPGERPAPVVPQSSSGQHKPVAAIPPAPPAELAPKSSSSQGLINTEYVKEISHQSVQIAQLAKQQLMEQGAALTRYRVSDEAGQRLASVLERLTYMGMSAMVGTVACGISAAVMVSAFGIGKAETGDLAAAKTFIYQLPIWLVVADRLLFPFVFRRRLSPPGASPIFWSSLNAKRLVPCVAFSAFLVGIVLMTAIGILTLPGSPSGMWGGAIQLLLSIFFKWFFVTACALTLVMWKGLPREGVLAVESVEGADGGAPELPVAGFIPVLPSATQIAMARTLAVTARRGWLAVVVSIACALFVATGGFVAVVKALEGTLGRMPGLTQSPPMLFFLYQLPAWVFVVDWLATLTVFRRRSQDDAPPEPLRWKSMLLGSAAVGYLYSALLLLPVICLYSLVFPPSYDAALAQRELAFLWLIATMVAWGIASVVYTVYLPRGSGEPGRSE